MTCTYNVLHEGSHLFCGRNGHISKILDVSYYSYARPMNDKYYCQDSICVTTAN